MTVLFGNSCHWHSNTVSPLTAPHSPLGNPWLGPKGSLCLLEEPKSLKQQCGQGQSPMCIRMCTSGWCLSSIHRLTSPQNPSVVRYWVPEPVLIFINSPALIDSHWSIPIYPPYCFVLFSVLEIECKALCKVGKHSTIELYAKGCSMFFLMSLGQTGLKLLL